MNLTGGGETKRWGGGWATAFCTAFTTSLKLEMSPDGTNWYQVRDTQDNDVNYTGITEYFVVTLPTGVLLRAGGTGTIMLRRGSATVQTGGRAAGTTPQ